MRSSSQFSFPRLFQWLWCEDGAEPLVLWIISFPLSPVIKSNTQIHRQHEKPLRHGWCGSGKAGDPCNVSQQWIYVANRERVDKGSGSAAGSAEPINIKIQPGDDYSQGGILPCGRRNKSRESAGTAIIRRSVQRNNRRGTTDESPPPDSSGPFTFPRCGQHLFGGSWPPLRRLSVDQRAADSPADKYHNGKLRRRIPIRPTVDE